MKQQLRIIALFSITLGLGFSQLAKADPAEIYCTIRDPGSNLACQWVTKEGRKTMGPEDIPAFVDAGQGVAYMTIKSRKGMERTFMIDGNAPQYKKLNEVKKTASISEIAKIKGDLFNEIEKRAIRIADDLDAKALSAELVKYDSSITNDKAKHDFYQMSSELEGYKKNKDKLCTSTPAFEQMTKANASLQQSLSSILYAFQSPDSCMTDFKIFKDKDGSVDLRQLDGVAAKFKEQCHKK